MSGETLRERLAAILAADAAGYSRLMAGDGRGTVAALDSARTVFREQIESNQGRVIDMAGDSVLAVFDLATSAVTAALAIQRELAAALKAVPEDRQMRFRIGVHLGEIIEKPNGTIYGDGVNIAARLEGLADPGGIVISDAVRGSVKNRVAATFEDMGEQTVKNIADPVRAHRLTLTKGAQKRPTLSVGEIDLSLPDKPSIAVLPFTNLSDDPDQEYFTDGVTEDIITDLSRFKSLFVIASNSSFSYKGKSPNIRQVSKELGVRYVVEGSIRRAGNRIRISAQLIDSVTGNHIWAERYDRVLEDIFDLQGEVTRAIVTTIVPTIDRAEIDKVSRRRPVSLSAYEIAVRARAHVIQAWQTSDMEACNEAIRVAKEALAIDPRSTLALNAIAWAQCHRRVFGTASDLVAAWQDGMAAASYAIDVDPTDSEGYAYKALLFCFDPNRCPLDEALTLAQQALELNPNSFRALVSLGSAELFAGNPQNAIDVLQRALRLSPVDSLRFIWYIYLSMACFLTGEYSTGIDYALLSSSQAPEFAVSHVYLVVNYVGVGDIEKAKSALKSARRTGPRYVEMLLKGGAAHRKAEHRRKQLSFLRVAAGLDEASEADAEGWLPLPS